MVTEIDARDINDNTSVIDELFKENENKRSDFSETVYLLLNDKFKRRKTILSDRQVSLLTSFDVIAQVYDVDFLKLWVDWFAEWKTSGNNGIGRKDIVEISKYNYAEKQKQNSELMELLKR